MEFKATEDSPNISIRKKETNYIVFNINYSAIKESTSIEYRSPVFKFQDPPVEECYISFVSLSLEKKSKFGSKVEGMTLHFMHNQENLEENCTYQVICSILHMPKFGTHSFQSLRCGLSELKHWTFFNLCKLGKVVNEQGFIQLCFDITRFTSNDSTTVESFLPQKAFYSDEKLYKLYCFALDDKYTDITFNVKGEQIKAHKNILAAHSTVFDAIFNSNMKEKQTGIIKIDEYSPEVIKELLYYIYTNNVQDLSKIFYDLFEAAHYYNLTDLETLCKNYMLENISVNNVTLILQLAEKYDLKNIIRRVRKFISQNESQMMNNQEYLSYLMSSLSVKNVSKCLVIADKYKLKDIKNQLKEFVRDNIKEVIKDSNYRDLYQSHMSLILEIDEFIASHYPTNEKYL